MSVPLAIALAVAEAVCFAVAAYLQHDAVNADRLHRAVRRPQWLTGLALLATGGGLHAVALSLAPLAVVQPVGVLALPLVAVLHARRHQIRLGAAPRTAIVAVAVGVAAFVVAAAIAVVPAAAPLAGYGKAGVFAGLGIGGLLLLAVASPRPGTVRCLAFAAAAGVAFALVSVLIRVVGQQLLGPGLDTVPLTIPFGVVAALVVGGLAVQWGYASGPPAVVVACLTIVDPLVSVGLGLGVLGEATSPTAIWAIPLGAACALLAIVGTVVLAKYHPQVAAHSASVPASSPPPRPQSLHQRS